MTVDDPVLSIENLEVVYTEKPPLVEELLPGAVADRIDWGTESVRAVDGVSLDVGEDDVVAVVGESGSGKTTLGKTAVALQDPTAGSVKYRGHDIQAVRDGTHDGDLLFEDVRRALQIVHQDPAAALNPYRTIRNTLMQPLKRWFPEMSLADRRERILTLLRECGLSPAEEYESRYPHELSGGEKQRVALIRAMFPEPDVILADEAVSALDPSLRVEIMDLMLELQEMFSTSYIFVTHNLEHARYLANKADGRIAIMYLGEIVEIGPAEDVIRNPSHPYTKVLKWSSLPIHPDRAREAVREEIPLRSLAVPDVNDKPTGCRFHTRCPEAREACVDTHPELVDVDDGANGSTDQRAACFREVPDHTYWDSDPLEDATDVSVPSE